MSPSDARFRGFPQISNPVTNKQEQIIKTSPIQKILFGSPGTGKSYKIDKEIIPQQLKIDVSKNPENIIKTVFHPEYTYGDFIGKLVPMTRKNTVEYNYHEGHFLLALSQAYKNIISSFDKNGEKISEVNNVVLVIDEINRGNSSAIFGTVFQLLDRDEKGWSSYGVNITDIEFIKLLELMGTNFVYNSNGDLDKYELKPFGFMSLQDLQKKIEFLNFDLINRKIRIPNNLSIVASMNTSDNSIYFMDSAFKRRWEWEFINWDNSQPPDPIYGKNGILAEDDWIALITQLNRFIKSHHASIRGIEDKQIGRYFIKQPVTSNAIQNKLMFFVWDSIFNRDKKPLADLLGVDRNQLVTFGDFTQHHNEFVKNVMDWLPS